MGSIYSVARHTVIYLGDSSNVVGELQTLFTGGYAPGFAVDMNAKYSDTDLKDLYDALETQILSHPWFTRVWVFQELLLSRDP
jgi:hypothetical protein